MTVSMRTLALAAAGTIALVSANPAAAKGPLETLKQSPMTLVKADVQRIDVSEFPWGLKDGRTEPLEVLLKRDVLLLPWVEVERNGDDKITVRMPESASITGRKDVRPSDEEGYFKSKNLIMSFERGADKEVSAFRLTSDVFDMTSKSRETVDPTDREHTIIATTGLTVVSDFAGFIELVEEFGARDRGAEAMRALDLGLDVKLDSLILDYDAPRNEAREVVVSNGTATPMPPTANDKDRIVFRAETGKAAFGISSKDNQLGLSTQIEDFDLAIARPMPINLRYGLMALDFTVPTESLPEPQTVRYLIKLEDVGLDETIWSLADPGEIFPRELNRIVIDADFQAIVTKSIFDNDIQTVMMQRANVPLRPTYLQFHEVAFDGLGLKLDARGDMDLTGELLETKAIVSLGGLSDFLAGLKKRGFIPESNANMIEGMARQMGKEGPDGALTYDIRTEDAMLIVNDAPVAPSPPVPPMTR